MKSTISGILIGCLVAISIQSTIPSVNGPAQPRYFIVETGSANYISHFATVYMKQGYIVDKLSYGGYGDQAMIVLCKYY